MKFAEAWAAQMQKCKAGKETRSIQIDLRSQFAKGDKRDEHYLHEPMDLGVLKPHVFESAEAVLAPSLRTNDWKAAYIFGFDTVRASDDEVTIYYNARSGYFPGVETVGASRLRVGRRGRAE